MEDRGVAVVAVDVEGVRDSAVGSLRGRSVFHPCFGQHH